LFKEVFKDGGYGFKTFYYLLGLFKKPQRAQRFAEKNNISLRLSVSSAVNPFCHDSFIRNKLKSHMDLEIQPGSPYNLPPEQQIYQPQLILYKKKW